MAKRRQSKKIIELQWPMAGLSRQNAQSRQAPFSTPNAINVRPFDSPEGRARGGTRPGIGKAYDTQIGTGPIRMLAAMATNNNDEFLYWQDTFERERDPGNSDGIYEPMGNEWGRIKEGGSFISKPQICRTPEEVLITNSDDFTFNARVGAFKKGLDFRKDKKFSVDLFIRPYFGKHNGRYQVYAFLRGSQPTIGKGGMYGMIQMTDEVGTINWSVVYYKVEDNGRVVNSYNQTGSTTDPAGRAMPGWLSLSINGDAAELLWRGTQLHSIGSGLPDFRGTRVGFSMYCLNDGGICLADEFAVSYKQLNSVEGKILVASSETALLREEERGVLSTVSTSIELSDQHQLQAADMNQKLFIADHDEPIAEGTDLVIDADNLVAGGWVVRSGNYYDTQGLSWADLAPGIDPNTHVIELFDVGTGVTAGTYGIHATPFPTIAGKGAAEYLRLDGVRDPGAGSATSFRIGRAHKVFDPSTDSFTLHATENDESGDRKGDAPMNCKLACRYRGRLVFAAPYRVEHTWYMSALNNAYDFDYTASDDSGNILSTAAVAGSSSESGEIGEPITALIPHSDDYLLFGCTNSLWVLRGDPAFGGMLDNLSRSLGVVGPQAWAIGPEGETLFMSRQGLYMVAAGGDSYPQAISRNRIPRALLGLDGIQDKVVMAYDENDRGFHIFVVPERAQRRGEHYWFDWVTKSFWPFSIPETMEPTTILEFYSQHANASCVLLGGRDGYLRRFRNDFHDDDGTLFESFVDFGPFRVSGDGYRDGMISEVMTDLDESSGDMQISIRVSDTAEAAFTGQSSVRWSQDFSAGNNAKFRPRCRAPWAVIRMAGKAEDQNGTNYRRPWMIERLAFVAVQKGKQRP